MTPISTTLPTEEGYYLFSGLRQEPHDVQDVFWISGAEVVRVTRDASQKIMYVGSDFFHNPARALGAWIPISEEVAATVSTARALAIDALARTHVPKAFEYAPDKTATKESILHSLSYPFDKTPIVEQVFERAVALRVIEATTTPGWFRLIPADIDR